MKRVLIVDDRDDNRYYLQVMLESQGYAVDFAGHGAEALELARKSPPDVVISDLLMPVMDGYTLLRHWKRDKRLMHIPFMVYSATYTDKADERLAFELGADAYMVKPTEPDQFVATLREVEERATAARPQDPAKDEEESLKHYNERLVHKLEKKMEELETANRILEQEVAERKAIEEEINFRNMILKTQQETSLDAILIVGEDGRILSYNHQFLDLWGLPGFMVDAGPDEVVLHAVLELVEDTEAFLDRIKYLYAHPEEKSYEELQLKDGRIVDRYSAPIIDANGKYYGRVWYFRDITKRRRYEHQLREQDSLLTEMSAMARIGGWGFDPRTGEGTWTEETARIHEVDPLLPTSAPFGLSFFQGADRKRIETALHDAVEHGKPYDLELELVTASGNRKWVRTICTPDVQDGQVIRVRGAMQDITEHKVTENRIKGLNRVLLVLSQINMLIVRVQDRNKLFREACKIATEAGGFPMAMIAMVEPEQKHIVPVASSGKDSELMDAIHDILSTNEGALTTMCGRAVQERHAVVANDSQNDPRVVFGDRYGEAGIKSMAVIPIMLADEAVGVLALYSDVENFFHTEEMQLLKELADDIAFAVDHIDKQERLDYLSFYDELTGLAKRSLFLERVSQHIRRKEKNDHKMAVCVIDLERFKNFSDSFGWLAGDDLLRQVAGWLTDALEDVALLARLDADHFAILVPDVKTDSGMARWISYLMNGFLEHQFRVSTDNTPFRVAAKAGLAVFPHDGEDADTMLKNAEAALKTAKKRGDRYLFHTKRMTESVADKLLLENQLREALEKEEFVLYYQPKFELASESISSAEALIRWNSPRMGLVPPDQFIPVLEETGLIHEVGRWALRKAVEDYLRWRSEGLKAVRIAVNVSPMQLRDSDFINVIKNKLNLDRTVADGLELEITETVLMENIERTIDRIHALREMGVHVTIDDFGTGFSSLSYIARLPADTVKIDRAFVAGMTGGPEGLALVSTIINLAHSQRLNVVAEGVETEEQARLLHMLGCDEVQGFLYGKPLSSDLFETSFLKPASST